ncbi:ShlB/FhaC/HecB family hemolysin secretion/activation protein, partial [Leptolyngbya sp. FACHB-36]|nr:ShlB/FhaC/HecB family hemolysin secretion/activation protein [Leptolyngbya sp. FACHB-36]
MDYPALPPAPLASDDAVSDQQLPSTQPLSSSIAPEASTLEFSAQVPNAPLAQPAPEPTTPPNTIAVTTLNVTGSTVLSTSDLKPLTQPLEGRS